MKVKKFLMLHDSINEHKLPAKITLAIFIVTLVSLYLSSTISINFYFFSVPISILNIYLANLTFIQIRDSYIEFKINEKYFHDGNHIYLNWKTNIQYHINIYKGKRHGDFVEFYPNGQKKKLTMKYKDGKKNGPFTIFYLNGFVFQEGFYLDNKINGEIKEYFENGELKFIINNDYYIFFANSKKTILLEGEFKEERPIGIWNNYRLDGTLEYQYNFDNEIDKKNNKVIKTVFTEKEEIFSQNNFDYNLIKTCNKNFDNSFSLVRLEGYIFYPGAKGPPGMANSSYTYYFNPITKMEGSFINIINK